MVRKIYLNDGKKQIMVVMRTNLGKVCWAKAAVKVPGEYLMTSIPVEKVKSSTLSEEIEYWIYTLKRRICKKRKEGGEKSEIRSK